MTPTDFTAWLRGFMAAVEDIPTPTQWAKISATLDEVSTIPGLAGLQFPSGVRGGVMPAAGPNAEAHVLRYAEK